MKCVAQDKGLLGDSLKKALICLFYGLMCRADMQVRGQLSEEHISLLPPRGFWDHSKLSCEAWRSCTVCTTSLVPSSS